MSGGGFVPSVSLADVGANFNADIAQQWGFIELTKSASANTKSAWYTLGTIKNDCAAILLRCGYLNNSGSDHLVLHDIGIGPSGSEQILISNIVQGQPAGTALTNLVIFQHLLPFSLPIGTRVAIRSSVDVASSTPHIGGSFTPISGTMHHIRSFAGFETLGQSGTAAGVQATGGAGTKGSYVTIGTATRDYSGVFLCFDFAGQSGTIRGLIDIAVGTAGNEKILMPNILVGPDVGFSYMDLEYVPVQVVAGTTIRARFCNLDGSTNKIGLSVYGVCQ